MMQTIKGMAAGLVAFMACPCHLPLTLPALLVLTGGTAIGGWLAANQWLVWLGSVVLFLGRLALMVHWMNPTGAGAHCEVPSRQNVQTQHAPSHTIPSIQSKVNVHTHTKEIAHV